MTFASRLRARFKTPRLPWWWRALSWTVYYVFWAWWNWPQCPATYVEWDDGGARQLARCQRRRFHIRRHEDWRENWNSRTQERW